MQINWPFSSFLKGEKNLDPKQKKALFRTGLFYGDVYFLDKKT